MSEQEARETACAIFGDNGDFYSFRKKPKSSSSTTIINESTKPIGFTESQINRIIEKADGRSVQFYINSKEFYYYKKDHPTAKIKIEDGLFYAFDSEINAIKVYPLGAIEHIKIFEKKKQNL